MFWKRKHLGIIWPKCKFKLTCGNDSDNSLIDLDFIFYFFIAQTLLSDSKIPSLAYQKQQKREDLTAILVNALMDLVAVVLQLMQFHIDFQLSIQLYFSSNLSGLKWVFSQQPDIWVTFQTFTMQQMTKLDIFLFIDATLL